MPTRIHQYGSSGARREERRRRQQLYQRRGVTVNAPFLGYCPDLPPHIGGWRLAHMAEGVVAAPISQTQRGEFLTNEDGFRIANNINNPPPNLDYSFHDGPLLGAASFSTAPGAPSTSRQTNIIHAAEGGGSLDILRRTGLGGWQTIAYDANINGDFPANTFPQADRDTLFDAAEYAFGAPTRTYTNTAGGGNHAGITVPLLIWAGGDETGPTIPVIITPDSTGNHAFTSQLWEAAFPGDLTIPSPLAHPFLAKSVETWDGRVTFFNTKEGGVAFPTRLRGSAIGTADPSNEEVGSFRVDFKDHTMGLRAETIGNQLACYFDDGVKFVQRTGRFSDPVRWTTVSRQRGLLSTHSLTPISASQHFGIFTDGWWLVDAGGRWTPVGTIEVPESGEKRNILHKWRETFRALLDVERKHLVVCGYDPIRRRVRISFPVRGQTNLVTWVYDVDGDRVWPMGDSIDVTFWGQIDQLIKSAETYADYASTTYGDVTVAGRTYGSFEAQFGLGATFHGDSLGGVYSWDPELATRDVGDGLFVTTTFPEAFYATHAQTVTENPNETQVLKRVDVEYMNVGGPGVSITAKTNNGRRSVTRSKQMDEGGAGEIHTCHGTFDMAGSHHELNLSTRAPFAIRSFRPEFIQSDNEGEVT